MPCLPSLDNSLYIAACTEKVLQLFVAYPVSRSLCYRLIVGRACLLVLILLLLLYVYTCHLLCSHHKKKVSRVWRKAWLFDDSMLASEEKRRKVISTTWCLLLHVRRTFLLPKAACIINVTRVRSPVYSDGFAVHDERTKRPMNTK